MQVTGRHGAEALAEAADKLGACVRELQTGA
jgi:hypothetical protein